MKITGHALVKEILPAAPRGPGRGCLVLMTVDHVASEILEIALEETREVMHLTPVHRLYAEGLGWVAARDLRPGQHLRADGRTLTIARVVPSAPNRRVYNFEVSQEHNYRVLPSHVWSHNQYVPEKPAPVPGEAIVRHYVSRLGENHFSVEIGGGKHTHQVVLNEKRTRTQVVEMGQTRRPPAREMRIPLPDVEAAKAAQNNHLKQGVTGQWIPVGPSANSCATHVCSVLSAGGARIPRDPGLSRAVIYRMFDINLPR
jgi:hypothetical protein